MTDKARFTGRSSSTSSRGKRRAGERQDTARADQSRKTASLLEQFTEITSQVTGSAVELARTATTLTALEGGNWLKDTYLKNLDPERLQAMADAGHFLKDAREVAGMNLESLAEALDMSDTSLLQEVEEGHRTLPMETIFRVASLIARHDPIPFIIQFMRTYNPRLGATLDQWGIAALPKQYERERRFLNIYRQHDILRTLSDAEYARLIKYVSSATEFVLQVMQGERAAPVTGGGRGTSTA
jgi:transcriptional regulator with XRE-family HTH domain